MVWYQFVHIHNPIMQFTAFYALVAALLLAVAVHAAPIRERNAVQPQVRSDILRRSHHEHEHEDEDGPVEDVVDDAEDVVDDDPVEDVVDDAEDVVDDDPVEDVVDDAEDVVDDDGPVDHVVDHAQDLVDDGPLDLD
ncbi:predicted protein [Lichtheimia corymbifera JMRC:FSU:9682]|uniref:Uncharacterized protein n=1 Tax=Lichtheimia corymbifera JMRC:FSU:9682 TaxID=1263082 RepID=A0A068RVB0_9FUNG|nr:predicted protein [Lichtheimia corymbifera JMRC:FSU:9682]